MTARLTFLHVPVNGWTGTRAVFIPAVRRPPVVRHGARPAGATLAGVLILAFDTATPAVTVAVHDGVRALASSVTVDARAHGELLAPGIDAVLAEAAVSPADITDVVVGIGPGPYTGLRVGVVTARTFGALLGIPVHGVCTLDVLARGSGLAEPFVVGADARRKEVYWARYAAWDKRVTEPAVNRPAELVDGSPAHFVGGIPVVGEGARLYPDVFPDGRAPTYPAAGVLAELAAESIAAGDPLAPAEPLYLRRPHAAPPGAPKRVSPR